MTPRQLPNFHQHQPSSSAPTPPPKGAQLDRRALPSMSLAAEKRSLTSAQVYRLAKVARAKLTREAACPDYHLGRLIGHANLLDALANRLDEAGSETAWFADIDEKLNQEEERDVHDRLYLYDSSSSDDDSDDESDSSNSSDEAEWEGFREALKDVDVDSYLGGSYTEDTKALPMTSCAVQQDEFEVLAPRPLRMRMRSCTEANEVDYHEVLDKVASNLAAGQVRSCSVGWDSQPLVMLDVKSTELDMDCF